MINNRQGEPSDKVSGHSPAESREAEPEKFRVQLVKKIASSKAQSERMRVELERQGFSVTLREHFTAGDYQEDYYADLFGEKRVPADRLELDLQKEALQRQFIADRKIGYIVKTFWWVLVLVGLLVYFSFTFPLWSVIKGFFD